MKILIYFIFIVINISYAQMYFLCGPDEDGCPSTDYQWCVCMPLDDTLESHPYCLNYRNVSCIPLSHVSNCSDERTFKNQATCIAVAFQGTSGIHCPLVSEEFCRKHRIRLCEKDGGQASCRLPEE